jgi:hypothetical protein
LGFGFYRKYSAVLSLKDILLTTPPQPGGTGDLSDAETKINIISGAIALSSKLRSPFHHSHKALIGFQLNLDHLNFEESIWRASAKSEDLNMNWKFGLIYDTQKYGKFSLVYEEGALFSGESEVKGLITAEPDTVNDKVTTNLPNRFTAEFPSRIFTGFLYDNSSWFSIFANINLVLWENVDGNLKNQVDLSGSLSIKNSMKFNYLIGFYHTSRKFKDPFLETSNFNAFFVTGGITLISQKYSIHTVIQDSHLSSKRNSQKTIIKLGINVNV